MKKPKKIVTPLRASDAKLLESRPFTVAEITAMQEYVDGRLSLVAEATREAARKGT